MTNSDFEVIRPGTSCDPNGIEQFKEFFIIKCRVCLSHIEVGIEGEDYDEEYVFTCKTCNRQVRYIAPTG